MDFVDNVATLSTLPQWWHFGAENFELFAFKLGKEQLNIIVFPGLKTLSLGKDTMMSQTHL